MYLKRSLRLYYSLNILTLTLFYFITASKFILHKLFTLTSSFHFRLPQVTICKYARGFIIIIALVHRIRNVGLATVIFIVILPLCSQLRSLLSLPLISFDWVTMALLGLMVVKLGVDRVLQQRLHISPSRSNSQSTDLEYSPFYHLAIVMLVLSEVEWNMFDVVIWGYGYVGVGIVRRGLLSIKLEKQVLLNGYAYDLRTIRLLEYSKVLGGILVLVSVGLFVSAEIVFAGVNVKIINMLVFPVIMLLVDSLFLFLSSAASEKDILCYYNQNINEIQPAYKLELVEKIAGSSVKVWHFYNLSRLFLKTLLDKMGILDYLWIFSVVNAAFSSVKVLISSIGKYRSYSKLMKKFDRLFRRSTSAPDQCCTICLTQLLNCRQLASCGHLFHYRCLFQWMQTKMQCPICRVPIQLS